MSVQPCPSCDGAGKTIAIDWDEHGQYRAQVECCHCEGCGEIRDCLACRAPMPANGGLYCGGCAETLGGQDQADEMARIRKVS